MDTGVSDLSLLTSSISLAKCIGLEMSEISKGDANAIEDDSLSWYEEFTLVEPCLE